MGVLKKSSLSDLNAPGCAHDLPGQQVRIDRAVKNGFVMAGRRGRPADRHEEYFQRAETRMRQSIGILRQPGLGRTPKAQTKRFIASHGRVGPGGGERSDTDQHQGRGERRSRGRKRRVDLGKKLRVTGQNQHLPGGGGLRRHNSSGCQAGSRGQYRAVTEKFSSRLHRK